MIRNLIAKELREHWLPFGAAAGLSFLGLGLVAIGSTVTAEAGNILEALRSFLITFGVPVALVICNRLVVREYQGKTQLFLESLPLTRGRMIVVKYALGLGFMAGFVALALAALLPVVAHRQTITVLFVEIVSLRALAFTFFVYSFFFATGMLGRYRMAIYAAILLGVLALSASTDMELTRFGPLALLDRTFPYERDAFPTEHLVMTFGLGAAFGALAFALALAREGSAAAMLAEKMSHREKMFVTAVLLGIVFLGSIFGKKIQKRPFDLADAVVKQSIHASVKVEAGREQDSASADALATRMHGELVEVAEYLDLGRPLPVFITTRRDLDVNRYERGELIHGEGLLVRANYAAAGFDRERFLMWILREYLISATNGRVELESKRWVLDGFGPFWMRRHRAADASASLLADKPLALRALYGTQRAPGEPAAQKTALTVNDLQDWMSFRERAGDGVAVGVAWSGLDVLARRQGPERMRNFLRAVLASPVPRDARALWFERRNPIATQIEQIAGVAVGTFLTAWSAELDTARALLADDLTRLPRLRGELWFAHLSPDTRAAKYRVALEPQPQGGGARVTLLHADLDAFDTTAAPEELQRENIDAMRPAAGELAGTWSRGGRFYWTFSLEIAALGCEVISGWHRREIE